MEPLRPWRLHSDAPSSPSDSDDDGAAATVTKHLDLSSRGLSAVPTFRGSNLVSVDLSRNTITTLAGLGPTALPNLVHLSLYFNRVGLANEVLHLVGHSCLETLDMRLNPVTRMGGWRNLVLARLPRLKTLDDAPVDAASVEAARAYLLQHRIESAGGRTPDAGSPPSPPRTVSMADEDTLSVRSSLQDNILHRLRSSMRSGTGAAPGPVGEGNRDAGTLASLEAAVRVKNARLADMEAECERQAATITSLKQQLEEQAEEHGRLVAAVGVKDARLADLETAASSHASSLRRLHRDIKAKARAGEEADRALAAAHKAAGSVRAASAAAEGRSLELEATASSLKAALRTKDGTIEGLQAEVDALRAQLAARSTAVVVPAASTAGENTAVVSKAYAQVLKLLKEAHGSILGSNQRLERKLSHTERQLTTANANFEALKGRYEEALTALDAFQKP